MTAMTEGPTDDLGREVGERIHAVMWRQKMSQTRLAPMLGLSQSVLSRKIRGDVPWWLAEVFTAAQVLGVDVSELVPPVPGPDDDQPKPAAVPVGAHEGTRTPVFCSEGNRGAGVRHLGVVPSTEPAPIRRAA